MQAPRLVASDVDGTLLGPDERVSPRTAAVVRRVVEGGIPFVLVTGRPPRWIPPIVEQLGDGVTGLAVCANGAVLYDTREDRVVWSRTHDVAALAHIADSVTAVLPGCGLAVERPGTDAASQNADVFIAEPDYQHAWPDSDHRTDVRATLLAEPAVKVLVRCADRTSEEMVATLAPVLGEAADLTFSHPGGLVEISPRGVTKATGLAAVAESFGVSAADVVAFGDMPNDLEMLRWAGHGVAMGNAHPALTAIADEVTASHAADGLAMVLERWF